MKMSTLTEQNIAFIADAFNLSQVLTRAGEEFSEATTAVIQYRRAAVDGEGDLQERRFALVDELADMYVMAEQVMHKTPGLRLEVTDRIRAKVQRTIKRYDLCDIGAGRVTRKHLKDED